MYIYNQYVHTCIFNFKPYLQSTDSKGPAKKKAKGSFKKGR